MQLLQHYEERVFQLSKELKVDDDEVLEVPSINVSHNFSFLSEHDFQPKKKTTKLPIVKEIDVKSDMNLQFLWLS